MNDIFTNCKINCLDCDYANHPLNYFCKLFQEEIPFNAKNPKKGKCDSCKKARKAIKEQIENAVEAALNAHCNNHEEDN